MTTLTLTPAAEKRIAALLAENPGHVALRVTVEGGGCAGFRYAFDLARTLDADDQRIGSCVVVDPVSSDMLAGATLDFVDNLEGQYFRVNHPAATSRCGCGNSFSL